MKTSNFPARKLLRRARAQGWKPKPQQIQTARAIRTKKAGGKVARRGW